jgi:hypothetical protein
MWTTIIAAVVGLLTKLAGSIPLLAVWLAERQGESTAALKQQAKNAEAQAKYAEIAAQEVTDEELDKRLSDGNL